MGFSTDEDTKVQRGQIPFQAHTTQRELGFELRPDSKPFAVHCKFSKGLQWRHIVNIRQVTVIILTQPSGTSTGRNLNPLAQYCNPRPLHTDCFSKTDVCFLSHISVFQRYFLFCKSSLEDIFQLIFGKSGRGRRRNIHVSDVDPLPPACAPSRDGDGICNSHTSPRPGIEAWSIEALVSGPVL